MHFWLVNYKSVTDFSIAINKLYAPLRHFGYRLLKSRGMGLFASRNFKLFVVPRRAWVCVPYR